MKNLTIKEKRKNSIKRAFKNRMKLKGVKIEKIFEEFEFTISEDKEVLKRLSKSRIKAEERIKEATGSSLEWNKNYIKQIDEQKENLLESIAIFMYRYSILKELKSELD